MSAWKPLVEVYREVYRLKTGVYPKDDPNLDPSKAFPFRIEVPTPTRKNADAYVIVDVTDAGIWIAKDGTKRQGLAEEFRLADAMLNSPDNYVDEDGPEPRCNCKGTAWLHEVNCQYWKWNQKRLVRKGLIWQRKTDDKS